MMSGSPRRALWAAGLLALAAGLVLLPIILHPAQSFPGSDDRAVQLIGGTPAPASWFHPLLQPGDGVARTALFDLQAALGLALLLALFLGLSRPRATRTQETPDDTHD